MPPQVKDELLERFLEACTRELDALTMTDRPQSMTEIQERLLQQQKRCLIRVVDESNLGVTADQIQAELVRLQSSTDEGVLKKKLDDMNEAARLAFCRLVLYSECLYEQQQQDDRILKTTGRMERPDLLEFCGLCQTAVRLPNVQRHLSDGSALFDTLDDSSSSEAAEMFPQKRLECIQRRFLRAVGYDPDHGTAEIQRIFFTPQPNEYSDDEELANQFATLASHMNTVIANATLQAQQAALKVDDGVTRVVSVSFSEKLVDAASGKPVGNEYATGAPSGEHMEQQAEAQQRASLRVAREAAALQQEILGELLAMRDEERTARLAQAKSAADDFMKNAVEKPAGTERVAFLRSVDPQTQRLMAMHKLWEGMVASNGGKDPVIHHNNNA